MVEWCGMADVPVGPGITLGGYKDADGVGPDVVTGMLRGPSGTPVKLTLATRGHTNDSIKVRAVCTVLRHWSPACWRCAPITVLAKQGTKSADLEMLCSRKPRHATGAASDGGAAVPAAPACAHAALGDGGGW